MSAGKWHVVRLFDPEREWIAYRWGKGGAGLVRTFPTWREA